MNKQMKQLLRQAAGTPDPVRKDAFIRTFRNRYDERDNTMAGLILSQVLYISWYIWIISAGLIILAMFGMNIWPMEMTGTVAALLPFVSMLGVLEIFRSGRYGMTELESVARVSFRMIYFARISCIGLFHLVMLILLIFMLGKVNERGYLGTGLLLTIPYLSAALLNARIERTEFGRKSILPCVFASLAISLCTVFAIEHIEELVILSAFIWCMIAAGLLAAILREVTESLKEVCLWN